MTNAAESLQTETVVLLPVDQCHKSPSQPRRRGDDKPDVDFVASIKQRGVIQPIVTRKRKAGGWEIVFGHRRHTGSAMAGRESIPAIVRELTDDEVFELQLIENVHRQDMHPLDEADGFKRIVDRGHDVQYIAGKVGRPDYQAANQGDCDDARAAAAAAEQSSLLAQAFNGVGNQLRRAPGACKACGGTKRVPHKSIATVDGRPYLVECEACKPSPPAPATGAEFVAAAQQAIEPRSDEEIGDIIAGIEER